MATQLERSAIRKFTNYYQKSQEVNRHELKAKNDPKMMYGVISTRSSLKTHLSSIRQVAKYLSDTKGDARNWSKITREDLIHYVESRISEGLAQKTIKAHITAINKLMVSEFDMKPINYAEIAPNLPSEAPKSVYKVLTSEEWENENRGQFEANLGRIELVKGFGLRRSELFGQKGYENQGRKGVTPSSFLLVEGRKRRVPTADGGWYEYKPLKIYVQTIGKNGRYRIAPCTNELNDKMIELYGSKALKISDSQLNKMMINKNNEFKQAYIATNRTEDRVVAGVANSQPFHIFRSYYARQRIDELTKAKGIHKEQVVSKTGLKSIKIVDRRGNELIKTGYTRLSSDDRVTIQRNAKGKAIVSNPSAYYCQIGSKISSVDVFTEVSNNLGHNRLDVLLKYI